MTKERRLGLGADVVDGGVHFRVFAPKRKRVEVVVESGPLAGRCAPLDRDAEGWFEGLVPELFVENAAYWIHEYHFDGLRLDATQSIFDAHCAVVLA